MRVKNLAEPVAVEPPRSGEDAADCVACNTPDDAYIWVSERWRVRGMDRPTGLPMVLILECRSHLDIGDLPNLLAAELGVMTVRLERAIRSLDGVARVHVNRWGDGSAHLHMWFLARPYGMLQLRGTFLSLWDDLLPVIPEEQWRENLALVAEWLAGFGGRAIAEPPHIHWQSPSTFGDGTTSDPDPATATAASHPAGPADAGSDGSITDPEPRSDLTAVNAETRDLSAYARRPAPIGDNNDAPAGSGEDAAPADGSGGSANGATPNGSRASTAEPAGGRPADASGTATASTTAATTAQPHTGDQDPGVTQPRPAAATATAAQHNSNRAEARDHQDADPEIDTPTDDTVPTIAAPPR
jgi:hypothetical protein